MSRICLLFLAIGLSTANWTLRGELLVNNPSFTNVFTHKNPGNPQREHSLLVSSFNPAPFSQEDLFVYRYIGENLDNLEVTSPQSLTSAFEWPREPSQVPEDVFGFDAVSVGSGFIPPLKDDGALTIVDVSDWDFPLTFDISTSFDPTLWFYHRITWKDIDMDGRKDAFTCRARRNDEAGGMFTEMVWFKQPPAPDNFLFAWDVTVMKTDICDVMSTPATLTAGGQSYDVIFTSGFFTQKLAVHWTTDVNGRWDDVSKVQTRIIQEGHKYFDAQLTDLNNDGRMEILVPATSNVNGSILVFEIPDDFRTQPFTEHLLATDFVPRPFSENAGSPGATLPFYPTSDTTGRAWISASGDDDGRAYILEPGREDWSYTKKMVYDAGEGNIVGAVRAFDADQDGLTELFVPLYTGNKILVYTYQPTN